MKKLIIAVLMTAALNNALIQAGGETDLNAQHSSERKIEDPNSSKI